MVYVSTVLNRSVVVRVITGLVSLLTCVTFVVDVHAQSKVIKLRNGAITNSPTPQLNSVIGIPESGLFLVQFTGPVQTSWRTDLAAQGVQLLRYVPDDTFIARFTDAFPGLIRSNPYVFWVGEFSPAYKVHSSIVGQISNPNRVGQVSGQIMLAPGATLQERAKLYGLLRSVRGVSRSRFGDVLNVELDPGRLAAVLDSTAVLWMEGPANMKLSDEVSTKIVAGGFVSPFNESHQSDVQKAGFDGLGVSVAVADSGLNSGIAGNMHPDLFGRVTDFFFYGNLFDASDEHSHGTHVTGIVAGDGAGGETDENGALYGMGVAPRSTIIAQRIFDGSGLFEAPESFEELTRDAVRAGADIGSNSWGDESRGRYDLTAAQFDALVRDADFETPGDQQYILEFSAGNSGPVSGSILSPAVSKNTIATGASQNDRLEFFIYADGTEAMADFSSRGPTEDGRIKPDIVAPGTWIASAQSFSASSENAWAGISPLYQYQGGTSQAGPHASGAAAIFVQWYREMKDDATPSPALVKAALINSAWDLLDDFGTAATPNMDEGWGRVDLPNLILGLSRREMIDQTELLETSETFEKRVVVLSDVEPLVITLTYTDVPGVPLSVPALVNDLDLEVISPDGTIYRGNRFDQFGLSIPGASAADSVNNVEGVYVDRPQRGEWIVRVAARNVVEDARFDTNETDQDFALVVSANLPLPDVAVLLMDRTAYRAPGEIKFRLIDFDLSTETSADINLSSGTEPAGFNVTLDNIGIPGIFTGSVATAVSPAVGGDGVLQISDSEIIIGEYYDASRNLFTIETAFADFQPPQFSFINFTNRFSRTFISVGSDELVDATIYFGTNRPPDRVAMSASARLTHQIELRDLVPGETYYVAVELEDIAGNVAYFDNNGNYLPLIAPQPATVLLVNDYTQFPFGSEGFPIPITEYTIPLQVNGVSYDIWDVETLESTPRLDSMTPYSVVIWRVNDDFWATQSDTLDSTERSAIEAYVNGGGAFFMSSMEIISRIGDVPFRANVFNVEEFVHNLDPFGEPCESCDEDYQVPEIFGGPGDVISSGVAASLDYSAFPSFNIAPFSLGPDLSDTFTPTRNVASTFFDIGGKTCGIRYPKTGEDSPGRIVFMSFPLEAIPRDGSPSGRAAILGNALRFLVPGLNGHGTITMDNSEYTIPDQVVVEVADTDLSGAGSTTINVFSQTLPAGVELTVFETITPGLFRGTLDLVAATAPASPGRLPTGNGETIVARYNDVSNSRIRQADALIDTIPPVISNVSHDASYTEALVAWETDEDTLALVEYGESPVFDGQIHKTVNSRWFDTSHALNLFQLKSDKQYYYKVTSRDVAGNYSEVSTGPGGQPLTFTTLDPLTPPWVDDMEQIGLYDWTLFSSDLTEVEWEQGPLAQGPFAGAVQPHSGNYVWASNRRNAVIGQAETFLISPPVELDPTLGNRASLKFWQNYDFFSFDDAIIIEGGELLVITNTATAPVSLAAFIDDASFGWEEQEFDLTPHIGKTVYFVWYYVFFSIENQPRTGWYLDDISVSMEQIDPGVLSITNNIAQATFNISGTLSRSRQSWYYLETNAPPGDYTISFNSVPFFQTPAPVMGTLGSGETLNVTGNYTIIDSNTNGISDLWEVQYLGDVDPNLSDTFDTDGDGHSDFTEFRLGTNPTNAASVLALSEPLMSSNNVIEIRWPTVSGRAYQLQSSSNVVDWKTLVEWYRSNGGVRTNKVLAPTNGAVIFRLRAQP